MSPESRELPVKANFLSDTGVKTLTGGGFVVSQSNITSAGTAPIRGTSYTAANHPAGDTVEAVSSDNADIGQVLRVVGIDMNNKRVGINITLNGTTVAGNTTPMQYIESMSLSAVCAGNVTLREASADQAIHVIAAGGLVTTVAHLYTGGWEFCVTDFVAKLIPTLAGNAALTLRYYTTLAHSTDPVTNIASSVVLETHTLYDTEGVLTEYSNHWPNPLVVPAGAYLCVSATGEGGDDEDVYASVKGFFRTP